MKQAQDHISQGPLGDLVSFKFTTGPDFLAKNSNIDALVMAHCFYYLPSFDTLDEIFASCRQANVRTLLLAEWALKASTMEGVPHVLAVLTQSIHPAVEGNIRTVFTPDAIIASAEANGYCLTHSKMIPSPEGMQDGQWEVDISRDVVKQALKEDGMEVRNRALRTHVEAMNASIPGDGKSKSVKCMDVWAAAFTLKQ